MTARAVEVPSAHRNSSPPAEAGPHPASSPYGRPWPLGATLADGGVNFAVFSEHARKIEVCLFEPDNPTREVRRLAEAARLERRGDFGEALALLESAGDRVKSEARALRRRRRIRLERPRPRLVRPRPGGRRLRGQPVLRQEEFRVLALPTIASAQGCGLTK